MTNSSKALVGVLLAGTVGIVIFLFVHFSGDPQRPVKIGSTSASAGCTQGGDDCLPDVNYTDITGKTFTPGSFKGKVTVINFWATWCPPCVKEIPALVKVYEKYKDKGLEMIGVMMDQGDPPTSFITNWMSDHEMTYPIVRGNSDIDTAYGHPANYPTTFVFDRSGRKIYGRPGGLDEASFASLVEPLL